MIKIVDEFNQFELEYGHSYYIKNEQFCVSCYRDEILFVDLANAMQPGKECRKTSVYSVNRAHGRSHIIGDLISFIDDFPPGEFMSNIRNCFYDKKEILGLRFCGHSCKSVRVFSPFVIPKQQKLDKIRTVSQVVKAILAGQVAAVICSGYYTDDYRHDASVNFCKGMQENILEFAKGIYESPGGWRVFDLKEKTLPMACHTFRYQEVLFL